jgi:phage host-nuclease inhibitor protein Gam
MEYLTEKEYNLIRDILKKHKDDIEDYEELELEDDKELERYIEKSDDDIAKEIKSCLIRARGRCEEDLFYDELVNYAKSKSVEWLTGKRYDRWV